MRVCVPWSLQVDAKVVEQHDTSWQPAEDKCKQIIIQRNFPNFEITKKLSDERNLH